MDSRLLASVVQVAGGLAVFFVLGLGAVLVHEAGHAAAALLCGFRILALRVGPIEIKRPKSFQWALSRNSLLSGLVHAQFRKIPGRWAGWQCLGFFLAGPLANFCLALAVFPFLRGDSAAANIGSLFLLVSVFIGAAQLIPFRIRENRSDGANIFLLMFSKRKRAESVFLFSFIAHINEVITLYKAGQTPSAYDKAEILITKCDAIPRLRSNADLMKRLTNLRDGLRKTMDDAENSCQAVEVAAL